MRSDLALSEYHVPINDAVAGEVDRLFRNIGIHCGQGSRVSGLPAPPDSAFGATL
jgi:hypothetical protein